MPLGVPQAVGESLLCLLWDGSLSFCQETGSQQLAGGNTMQVPDGLVEGTGCPPGPRELLPSPPCSGLMACCHGSSLMALVCLPAWALWER